MSAIITKLFPPHDPATHRVLNGVGNQAAERRKEMDNAAPFLSSLFYCCPSRRSQVKKKKSVSPYFGN